MVTALSYGVVWRHGDAPLARGKLELLPHALRLDGVTGGEDSTYEISYRDLEDVRIGRSALERLGGRPSLVLGASGGATVTIASVGHAGVVTELAERLAELQLEAHASARIAVVVPLLPGSRAGIEALLAEGPPFDPDLLGLGRHDVLLTDEEAIFIFEAAGGTSLELLFAQPDVWRRAAAWHGHLAGPPRIAHDGYHWRRPESTLDPQLLPPGLHDSASVQA